MNNDLEQWCNVLKTAVEKEYPLPWVLHLLLLWT